MVRLPTGTGIACALIVACSSCGGTSGGTSAVTCSGGIYVDASDSAVPVGTVVIIHHSPPGLFCGPGESDAYEMECGPDGGWFGRGATACAPYDSGTKASGDSGDGAAG